jgi:threonine dehydrogenase-like Zn-dependent dehydrogenase
LYFKELRVIGSNAFGIEEVGGVRKHAFEHYFDWVAAGLDLSALVTHRFRLSEWDTAVLTAADAKRTGAIKIVMRP